MLNHRMSTLAALASLAVVLTACGEAPAHGRHTTVDAVRAVDPSVAALNPDAKLDRSLSLPGMRGVLRGVVGTQTTQQVLPSGVNVTLSDFTVDSGYGFAPAAPAYTSGQHIQIAIPGGDLAGSTTTVEDAPTLRAGQQVFIFVQSNAGGQLFSGLPAVAVLLRDKSSVATVDSTRGIVHWEDLTEATSTFTQHFIQHPRTPSDPSSPGPR